MIKIKEKGDDISPLIYPDIEMPILTDYLNESEHIQELRTKWQEYISDIKPIN